MSYIVLSIISIVIFSSISGVFFLAQIIKNNSILDVFWGLGFVIAVDVALALTYNFSLPSLLVSFFVSIWGLRLAYHIFRRNKGKPEDKRYSQFRQAWKGNFLLKSYLQLFVLQGALLQIIAFSAIGVIVFRTDGLRVIEVLGAIVWGIGFFFEVVGDWQLSNFKNNPRNKGKVMTHGLWSLTRHPNYFGEATMWWGIWLFSLSTPVGLIAIVSPILITFMLMKVSGVTMLEQHYQGNDAYEQYKRNTPAFFPTFRK